MGCPLCCAEVQDLRNRDKTQKYKENTVGLRGATPPISKDRRGPKCPEASVFIVYRLGGRAVSEVIFKDSDRVVSNETRGPPPLGHRGLKVGRE